MGDKTNVSDEEIEANFDNNLIENAESIIEEPNLQYDANSAYTKHITVKELDVLINFLVLKKRGQYPSTMRIDSKIDACTADMLLLKNSEGPNYRDRRFVTNKIIIMM
jgi:hypothetical protein